MLLWSVLFVVGIASAILVDRELRRRREQRKAQAYIPGQYSVIQSPFNASERAFYSVIQELDLPGIRILAKVRLAEVFQVRRVRGSFGWSTRFWAISQRRIDFLLIRESDCRPVLGIELRSGEPPSAKTTERIRFIKALFADCGLPFLRIPPNQVQNHAAVRRMIYDAAPLTFPLSGFAETLSTIRPANPHRARTRSEALMPSTN